MAKNMGDHITERQLRMLEMRYQGLTLSEVGERFGITAEGVRVNVNLAAHRISKYGLAALPDSCSTTLTAEQLISVRPKRKNGPRPLTPDRKPSLDDTILAANTRTSEQTCQSRANTKTQENGGTER